MKRVVPYKTVTFEIVCRLMASIVLVHLIAVLARVGAQVWTRSYYTSLFMPTPVFGMDSTRLCSTMCGLIRGHL